MSTNGTKRQKMAQNFENKKKNTEKVSEKFKKA